MSTEMSKDIQRLAELKASGAITQEQFDRLSRSVLSSEGGAAIRATSSPAPHGPQSPQGPSLLRVAGAAGAGALAGVLAADLIQNALSDPPPEVLEASIVETTTLTEDGYVTHGDITLENSSGEVVAEGSYVEEASWDEQGDPQAYQQDPGSIDAGWDSGGMDFGGF